MMLYYKYGYYGVLLYVLAWWWEVAVFFQSKEKGFRMIFTQEWPPFSHWDLFGGQMVFHLTNFSIYILEMKNTVIIYSPWCYSKPVKTCWAECSWYSCPCSESELRKELLSFWYIPLTIIQYGNGAEEFRLVT